MKNLNKVGMRLTVLSAFFVMLLMLLSTNSFAQTPQTVNITVNITPPYSPFYADYSGTNASKVLLLVQNLTATTKTIKLTGQLTGNNGIKITTKSNYVPLQPIILNPNETKQLNGLALTDIFDLNSLNVYGIDKSRLIYTSRLPEGNYTFCIQAVDMATNQVISSNAPLGCTSITIDYPDAPTLISPYPNETLQKLPVINFTWINNFTVPGSIQYHLQVAEMPDVKTDPNQVLNATSFLLIDKLVMSATTITLGMGETVKLKEGKRYAWRIKAEDPTGKVIFKNNGISKANEFRYGAVVLHSTIALIAPKQNIQVENLNDLIFNWNFVDNTSLDDKIGFYESFINQATNKNGMFGATNFGGNSAKFELHIKRIKTEEEKNAERSKTLGVANSLTKINNNAAPIADEELIVNTNESTLSYKSSAQLTEFLKNGNNYTWYVKHIASGTVSETRPFTVQYKKEITNYNINLAGRVKYQFYSDYMKGGKAYPLQNRIQVVQFSYMAPIYKVTKKVTVLENGKQVTHSEEVDSVATVSYLQDLSITPLEIANAKIVAFGTTDINGNFNISVPITTSQYKVNDTFPIGVTGRMAHCTGLAIRINDGRFSDPNWFIFPTEDKTNITLKDQTVQIFDYNLNVQFTSKLQRDVKGKVYVLRNKLKTVDGEVDEILGRTKDIKLINVLGATQLGNLSYNNNFTNYSVVGVQNVAGKPSLLNSINNNFSKMVANQDNEFDVYTVFFESDNTNDALYFSPQTVTGGYFKKSSFLGTVFKKQTKIENIVLGPKFLTAKLSGRYLYQIGKQNKLPLPEGVQLSLSKGLLKQGSSYHNLELDNGVRIGSTKVGKNGEYSFDLGMYDYDTFNKIGGGNDLVITVESSYYASDDVNIKYDQDNNIIMPELVAQVREFSFTSQVVNYELGKPVNQMQVYLCRIKGQAPLTIPKNEADPDHDQFFKKTWKQPNGVVYDIIAQTPTGSKGEFTFNGLVRPSGIAGDEYFIFAEPQSTSSDNFISEEPFELTKIINVNLKNLKPDEQIFKINYNQFKDGEGPGYFIWNGNILRAVYVKPQNPYIEGAVYPYSNAATNVLAGAKVELFDMNATDSKLYWITYFGKSPIVPPVITDENGRFEFKLLPQTKGKMLRVSKQGFITTYKPIQDGLPLTKGQRAIVNPLYINLPLSINATVVNESGEKIGARIVVGDDFSWGDVIALSSFANGKLTYKYLPAPLKSPEGDVSFTIIPTDNVTYKTTVVKKTITKSINDYQFTVKTNAHNFIVKCIDETTGKTVDANVYVTNITAKPTVDKFSVNGIYVNTLSFVSAGNSFNFKVVPVGNYTIAKTTVYSDMSKNVEVTVTVQPAVTINLNVGVQSGNRSEPIDYLSASGVKNYNISIKDLNEDEYLLSMARLGEVNVSHLPRNKNIVIGVSKTNYLGKENTVYTDKVKTVNYVLTALSSDLPTNFYGFPVEYTKAVKSGAVYTVSGRLNPKGNENLSALKLADDNNWLRFSDVKISIVGSGILAKTLIGNVVFDENTLDGKLFNNYAVTVRNDAGLSLAPDGTKASIIGNVSLDPVSLSKGISVLGNGGLTDLLYLNKQTESYTNLIYGDQKIRTNILKTFTTATSDVYTTPLLVSNYGKRKFVFGLIGGFRLVPSENVLLNNNGMSFNSIINSNLENVSESNIQAKAKFNIDNSKFSLTNQEPLNIKLNKWQLEFKNWTVGKNGFSGNGNLNALGITIPFNNLQLSYTAIGYGDFEVKSLKLLNIWPVSFSGSEVITSFGFDKGYSKDSGAWALAVLAKTSSDVLASISGLPDLDPTDKIQIRNINLYDTGNANDTRITLVDNHPKLNLNNISSFKPSSIFGSLTSISFRGGLDMNIPNLSGLGNVTYDLKYEVVNGKLNHIHDTPFKDLVLDAKGVKISFLADKSQVFANNVLKLKGILTDKAPSSKYAINVTLSKDKESTKVFIADDVPADKNIYLSEAKNGSYLANSTGSMKVDKAVWSNFSFQGDLTGADGVNPTQSRLGFVIKGDIISDNAVANKDAIGVQNLNAGPVKGLNLTYDFTQKALVGSVSGIQQTTSFADFTLDMELKISRDGWYMFSNGIASNIKYLTFLNQVGIGTIIGNTDITSSQLASFSKQYKDNDVPAQFNANFKHVSGIAMVLSADIKLPIVPTFDLDLDPVAHCDFNYGVYGNVYFKSNFSTDPSKTELALGARLGAYVKLGVGASIGLACAGINLSADAHVDLEGKVAGSGDFNFAGALKFTLKGEAYVGAGVCNSNCETPCIKIPLVGKVCSPIPCFKTGLKHELVLGMGANLNNNGFSFGTVAKAN